MKALLINGSPNSNGCTATALGIVAKELKNAERIADHLINVGNTIKE